MKVSQAELSQSQIVLNIEVEPPELEEHLDRVYRRVVQRANIPGFRKGKAPRSVVERFVGRDALLEDAMETLLPQMTSKAIEEQELDVVATPRVQVIQQDPLTIEATVPVRPEVQLGDYYDIRLEQEPISVTAEEVDNRLSLFQRESGTWEPVERPVEMGDMVTIDVTGDVDGVSEVDEKGVDYVLAEGSPNPLPGFPEELVGSAIDESREFSLPFPDDYFDTDKVGKECRFNVTVVEVKERKLPELDDDFAQSLGMETTSMEELREKIEEEMLKQSQMAADNRFEDLAIRALVDISEVELPPLLVESEVDSLLSDQAEAMRRQQVSMEDYLSTVGKSVEELQEEARPQAEERLIRSLTLQAFREREGLEVTSEDIEEELGKVVVESVSGENPLRNVLESEEGRRYIENMLINRKTLERLVQIAKGEAIEAASSPSEALAEEGQDETQQESQEETQEETEEDTERGA